MKEAENAVHTLDGVSFGKNVLHVNRFGDIQRFASMPVGEGDLPSGWKEKEYIEKVKFGNCLMLSEATNILSGLLAKLAWGYCWERPVCNLLGNRGYCLVERTQWNRRGIKGARR